MPKHQNIDDLKYLPQGYALVTRYHTASARISCTEMATYTNEKEAKRRRVTVARDYSSHLDGEYMKAAIAWLAKYKAKFEYAQIVAWAETDDGMIFFYRH